MNESVASTVLANRADSALSRAHSLRADGILSTREDPHHHAS
jgi:hypothetical protein